MWKEDTKALQSIQPEVNQPSSEGEVTGTWIHKFVKRFQVKFRALTWLKI